LRTPLLENPETMTFWLYASASTITFNVEYSTSVNGPWSNLPGSPINMIYPSNGFYQHTFDLSSYQNIYIRFRRSGNKTYYLDDVKITGYLIPDTTAPCSISNLTAIQTNTEGAVKLVWTSPGDDGETGNLNNALYRIKYSTVNFTSFTKNDEYNIEFSTTGVAPKTEVSYIVRNLAPGTSYYFGIIAKDDSNNWSTWTKDENLGINTSNYAWTLDLPPSPPSQISATSSNRSVTLSWQHPSPDPGDIDKYCIYQATYNFTASTENSVVHIATVSYPNSQITITGLTNGIEYFFKIQAVDKSDTGDGYYGEALKGNLSETVSSIPKIRPPKNLVAKHYGEYVLILWEHSPDFQAENFARYNIYRSTDNSYFSLFTFSLSNSATDYSVEKTKTYYYLVRTSDTFGSLSDPSNIAEAVPDLIPPKIQILRQITSRDLAKDIAFVEFKILDDRFNENDKQGKIISVTGKYRNIATQNNVEKEIKITGEGLDSAEFIGKGELDFTIFVVGKDGIEYYLEAKDEVNTTRYPEEQKWLSVSPPEDKPEQKFVTPKNPEVVFGKDAQEVVIRDYQGNELWRSESYENKLIIWRGEDKQGKKLESGAYIYQIKTKDGKRKYGVVIVVK
ncbi:MAG: fibronectin type III domain-containing protein, partial [Endomicrobiia bacterium]